MGKGKKTTFLQHSMVFNAKHGSPRPTCWLFEAVGCGWGWVWGTEAIAVLGVAMEPACGCECLRPGTESGGTKSLRPWGFRGMRGEGETRMDDDMGDVPTAAAAVAGKLDRRR